MTRRGRPPTQDILTPREWEVLEMLRGGLTNQAIADRMGISLSGAKHHVSEIIGKLGVESREEAAAWRGTRRLPLLALPVWLLKPRTVLGAGPAVFVGVITPVLLLLLIVALVRAVLSPETSAVLQSEAVASPTAESVAEPQRGQVAGYDVGYVSGGGYFDSLVGDVLSLEEQVGSGTVAYVLDSNTRFLWADDERVRFDDSRNGLAPGMVVAFGFDSLPAANVDAANTVASVNQIPLDYVIIGYFKYLDGTVLDIEDDLIEVQLNPQLVDAAESLFGVNDGRVRVRLDPGVEKTDMSPGQEGLRAGVKVGFSGLVNASRQPLAYRLLIQ